MSLPGLELDSRTASFERRRRRHNSSGPALLSTSRVTSSRRKLLPALGEQDVRDFVPAGGSFTSSTSSFAEDQGMEGASKTLLDEGHVAIAVVAEDEGSENNLSRDEHEEESSVSVMGHETLAVAQPMNWNNVTKSKIRVTLGTGRNARGEGLLAVPRQGREESETPADMQTTMGKSGIEGAPRESSSGLLSTSENMKTELQHEQTSHLILNSKSGESNIGESQSQSGEAETPVYIHVEEESNSRLDQDEPISAQPNPNNASAAERAAGNPLNLTEEAMLVDSARPELAVPLSVSVETPALDVTSPQLNLQSGQQPAVHSHSKNISMVHSEYEIQLQRRYFSIVEPLWGTVSPGHMQRDSGDTSTIAANVAANPRRTVGLMRCLSCGRPEHPEVICPGQQCGMCNKIGDHFTPACTMARWSPTGMSCALCKEDGHKEHCCDLIWRTFLPGPENIKKVKTLLVFCFNCGSQNHYGLDCRFAPLRGYNETGRATFTSKQANLYLEEPMMAESSSARHPNRGLRQNNRKENADSWDSEDEPSNFVRPRISKDGGDGKHIRFGTENSYNQMAFNHNSRNTNSRREGNAPYRVDFRSRASQQSGQGSGQGANSRFRGDRWHPPSSGSTATSGNHGDTRSRGRGRHIPDNSYRPMPSAGRNAWNKHRT